MFKLSIDKTSSSPSGEDRGEGAHLPARNRYATALRVGGQVAIEMNGETTRHSPTGDAGLASPNFALNKDAPWLPSPSVNYGRARAMGSLTGSRVRKLW